MSQKKSRYDRILEWGIHFCIRWARCCRLFRFFCYVSSEEETLETAETETELVPETTRVSSENLPDTAIYNDTVLDNYTLTIDAAQRFTINYPKDFSVDKEDAYKTISRKITHRFLYTASIRLLIIAMKYTTRIRSRMPCTVCPIQLMEKTIPSPSSIGILWHISQSEIKQLRVKLPLPNSHSWSE